MRLGALFSGGKDSTYAAYHASKDNELVCLITLFPKSNASYMFHYPNLKWTKLQAESMRLPQVVEETAGVKEEELADLSRAISRAKKTFGLQGICTGALASKYQKTRVEKVCSDLSLECVSPLWGANPEAYLKKIVEDGFIVMIVSVSALGLDESWLGRVLDRNAVVELVALSKKYRFHAGLEGGEGETFVLDSPLFSKRIEVASWKKKWNGDSGTFEILDAKLMEKA